MPQHTFGLMERAPVHGERYDRYEPWAYDGLSVEDELLEPLLPALALVDFFWHSLDVPGKGLAYYGITLIPPASMDAVIPLLGETPGLCGLRDLLAKARDRHLFVIHFGI